MSLTASRIDGIILFADKRPYLRDYASMVALDAKNRFTDRVEDYQKYRPAYPPEVVAFLRQHCPVLNSWTVADVGAGTGISTKLLLDGLNCQVWCVEPNEAMRKVAEQNLGANPLFKSCSGSAEATGLSSSRVDMVTAFQAFHWFPPKETRREFLRILKSPRWVLLVWNDRVIDSPGFLQAYEDFLRQMPEYLRVNHRNVTLADITDFIGNREIMPASFDYSQSLDWTGLLGRFSSSSYTPKPGSPEQQAAVEQLRNIFAEHQKNGAIDFQYRTKAYLGKMTP